MYENRRFFIQKLIDYGDYLLFQSILKIGHFLLVRLATKYVYDQLPNGVIDRIKEKRGQKRVIRNTSGINY